jgi:hypothetical protein
VAIFDRLFGLIAGGALARASGRAIDPTLETAAQKAWGQRAVKVLTAHDAALADVKGFPSPVDFADDAKRQGVGAARYDALKHLLYTFPGPGALDDLTNRELVSIADAKAALKRLGYTETYIDALVAAFQDLLSPAEVANAVQQGHVPNEGILPDISAGTIPPGGATPPDTPDGQPRSHVPLTQIDLSPTSEAAGSGIDLKRLKVLANLVGLPPGPETLLTMWNRGLIDEESVDAGIREGHMKTKWTGAFKRMRWAVLAAQEYANAHLREWITEEEMWAGGALTGHTKEQMRLLYLNRGRPAAPGQMWTAWARKVIGPRGVPTDYTDHEQAIRRSNIRPEYAEMLWGIRFTYPPYFQVNRLVQAGAIDAATGADWMHKNRAAPEVVDAFVKFWQSGDGGGANAYIGKAQTQLWNATHTAYVSGEIDDGTAQGRLGALDIPADDQQAILVLWSLERQEPRRPLSADQLKKAYLKDLIDRGAVLVGLAQAGYGPGDADLLVRTWEA